MSAPRELPYLRTVGWATYYHAADGVVYRVHDTLFAQGRHTTVSTGSRPSHYRIFRPQEGPRRIYKFRDLAEDRRVEVELVAQQLRQSEYMATQKAGADATDPR